MKSKPIDRATAHGLWACSDGSIRVTPDGKPSVFDVIRVVGGQRNPRQVWTRLLEQYGQKLSHGCDHFQFPGQGQKPTPVIATKQAAYELLGLLPGEVGDRYRKEAAELFVRFLEDPEGLANELIDRLTPEQLAVLRERLEGKDARTDFADVLKDHGVTGLGYARCTNAIYIPVLGATAKKLKEEIAKRTGLPLKGIKTRDHFTLKQLHDVKTAEQIAAGQLRLSDAQGNEEVEHVTRLTAEYTRQLLDGAIAIPGLPFRRQPPAAC